MTPIHRLLALPLLLLAAAGCATPKDEPIIPLAEAQLRALYAKSRPPQAYGLTVYTSDDGPVFAGSVRLHPGDIAEMPFLGPGDSTAPMIQVDRRKKQGWPALIDTTSRENWADLATGQALGLVVLANPSPYQVLAAHVYDEIGGVAGIAQKVILDESHVENVVFHQRLASGPLGPIARWSKDPAPALVLGTPFLRAFSFVQLNYVKRVAVFSATTRFPAPPADALLAQVPFRDVGGALGVEGTLDGDPVTILLDVAGDFALSMNEPPDETLRRLSIGDLVFPADVAITSGMDIGLGPTTHPRIGRRLLSRYKVTFDFRTKTVYFERPEPPK